MAKEEKTEESKKETGKKKLSGWDKRIAKGVKKAKAAQNK